MTTDTAWSHHAPKVLTEADAAADLAGLPRPVSSEGARAHADFLDFGGHEKPANLIRALVSERDALAGRVAELEAERDRWHQRARELLAAFGEPQPFTHQGMFDRPMTFGGCPFCGRKECVAGECRAALSATTPESKP